MSKSNKILLQVAAAILVGFNFWVWYGIAQSAGVNAVSFLDVGQGDGQLITLSDPDNESEIKILIDAGRGRSVLSAIDAALGRQNNKYIDILVMTHPDLDHFGGFIDVIKRYKVGLLISNGLAADTDTFKALTQELKIKNVPQLTLRQGDVIRFDNTNLFIIHPEDTVLSEGDRNDASLVMMMEFSAKDKILFTGDIGQDIEDDLIAKGANLDADILKVAHHGSKESTGENFLAAVSPIVSVIGVGENRYGHPTERVLEALEFTGTEIFRTDKDGTVKIFLDKDYVTKPRSASKLMQILTGRYKKSYITMLSLPRLKSVPQKVPPKSTASSEESGLLVCKPGQININAASASELNKIRHIGEARAQSIIDNRPFSSVEALRGRVSGIWEKRIADILSEGLACAE